MKLSKKQQALHWRLMKQAMPLLMPGRETWTKLEETAARHALYIRALGVDKSLTAMDDDDFDAVLGELKAIINPSDLVAQLRQLNMRKTRRLYRIRELSPGDAYVQEIIDKMDRHGRIELGAPTKEEKAARPDDWEWKEELERGERPQRRLEDLNLLELDTVIVALRKQEARGVVYQSPSDVTDGTFTRNLTQHLRDRRRHKRLVGGPMPTASAASHHPF